MTTRNSRSQSGISPFLRPPQRIRNKNHRTITIHVSTTNRKDQQLYTIPTRTLTRISNNFKNYHTRDTRP